LEKGRLKTGTDLMCYVAIRTAEKKKSIKIIVNDDQQDAIILVYLFIYS